MQISEGVVVGLEMKELLQTMPQIGVVEWIGVRPARREPIQILDQAEVNEQGLVGDRYNGPADGDRMITLIQQEHISAVASILAQDSIAPALLRRNIVVSGINLQALKKNEMQIGDAVLFVTGNCPPCSRMEENLGPGGYNAMRGHGGVTARVVSGGTIKIGSQIRLMPAK